MNNNQIDNTVISFQQNNVEHMRHESISPLKAITGASNVATEGPGSLPMDTSTPERDRQPLANLVSQPLFDAIKAQKSQQQIFAREAFRAIKKRASRSLPDEAPKPAQRFSFTSIEQWGDASRPKSFNGFASTGKQATASDDAELPRPPDRQEHRVKPPVTLRAVKPVPRPRTSLPAPPPEALLECTAPPQRNIPPSDTTLNPISRSHSLRLPSSRKADPENLQKMKKAFSTIILTYSKNNELINQLHSDPNSNTDKRFSKNLYNLKDTVDLLCKCIRLKKPSYIWICLEIIMVYSQRLAGMLNVITHDTKLIMALIDETNTVQNKKAPSRGFND